MVLIKYSEKCVLLSLQFLSPGIDLELRELIMNDEEVMKILEAVGFRGVATLITLETRMNIIRYVSCCWENLSKSSEDNSSVSLNIVSIPFNWVNWVEKIRYLWVLNKWAGENKFASVTVLKNVINKGQSKQGEKL